MNEPSMNLKDTNWISMSLELITGVVNKKLDKTIALEGRKLYNYVGTYLGLPQSIDPSIESAPLSDIYRLYGHEQTALIHKFIIKMYADQPFCNACTILVIPVVFYGSGELLQVPVLQFQIGSQKEKMIDVMGRVYVGFNDFLTTNKFPAGKICYPTKGKLKMLSNLIECCTRNTPNFSNVKKGFGYASSAIGVVGGVGAILTTGGLALPFLMATVSSTVYETGSVIRNALDRKAHDESINPFPVSKLTIEENYVWLSVAANLLSFAHIGCAIILESADGKTLLDRTNPYTKAAVMTDNFLFPKSNTDSMSFKDKISLGAAICFWTKKPFTPKCAEKTLFKITKKGLLKSLAVNDDITDARREKYWSSFMDPNEIRALICFCRLAYIDGLKIEATSDFTSIILNGIEIEVSTIVNSSLKLKLLYDVFSKISLASYVHLNNFRERFPNDMELAETIWKNMETHAYSKGITQVIETLIEIFNFFLNYGAESLLTIQETRLTIGKKNRFTISNAFKVFMTPSGVTLAKELAELNLEECPHLTMLRETYDNDDHLFKIIEQSKYGIKKAISDFDEAKKSGLLDDSNPEKVRIAIRGLFANSKLE